MRLNFKNNRGMGLIEVSIAGTLLVTAAIVMGMVFRNASNAFQRQTRYADVEAFRARMNAEINNGNACQTLVFSGALGPVLADGNTYQAALRYPTGIYKNYSFGSLKIKNLNITVPPPTTGPVGVSKAQLIAQVQIGTTDETRTLVESFSVLAGPMQYAAGGGYAAPGTKNPWKCLSNDDPKSAHLVFVTSSTYNGNLGGLSGADAKCQAQADAGGLGGSWRAILSDGSISAKDRLLIGGPIYDMHGLLVAKNAEDLWDGALSQSIHVPENWGSTVSVRFSGTQANGSSSGQHCNNWTSSSALTSVSIARNGPYVGAQNQEWIEWSTTNCTADAAIMCISEWNIP